MRHPEILLLNAKLGELEKLLEFMPDAMLVADAQGGIAALNAHAEKLFGFRKDELLG